MEISDLIHAYRICRTMPMKMLKEFGWDFNDKSERRLVKDNMRFIYSTKPGDRISIWQPFSFQRPGEREDPGVKKTAKNLQGRIMENITRVRQAVGNHDGVLAVPADWGVGTISFGDELLVEYLS
jgi:hypothetical protein